MSHTESPVDQSIASNYTPEMEIEIPAEVGPFKPFEKPMNRNDRKNHPIDVLTTIRNGIENLNGRTIFKQQDVIPDFGTYVNPIYFEILGAWKAPEDRVGGHMARYVNPHADDAYLYSDCFPTCACGALVTTTADNNQKKTQIPAQTDHTDDCISIDRWRARARLWETRRLMFTRMFRLGLNTITTPPRMGYSSPGSCHHHAKLGVDAQKNIDIGRRRIATSAVINLDERSATDMANAFGYSRETMRRLILDHFPEIDLQEMYTKRRANGVSNS